MAKNERTALSVTAEQARDAILMNPYGGQTRTLRARRRSHTHEHDSIVEILLWHNEVITDWALQGWKEETQKETIRLGISFEWNPYFDILWDADTGRMP